MTRTLVLIGAVLAASSGGASAADVAAGEQAFKQCVVCHSIGPDAKNKVGPMQNGLDGRKAGTVAGFNYSDANKNSGITWNEQTFEQYIKAPQAMIPGTKMIPHSLPPCRRNPEHPLRCQSRTGRTMLW